MSVLFSIREVKGVATTRHGYWQVAGRANECVSIHRPSVSNQSSLGELRQNRISAVDQRSKSCALTCWSATYRPPARRVLFLLLRFGLLYLRISSSHAVAQPHVVV